MSDKNHQVSKRKLENLIDKIKANPNLASKLGLMEEMSPSDNAKRRCSSPTMSKKLLRTADGRVIARAGSPDEIASVKKTSTCGPSISIPSTSNAGSSMDKGVEIILNPSLDQFSECVSENNDNEGSVKKSQMIWKG